MDSSSRVDDPVRERVEVLFRTEGDRLWRAVLGFAGDPDVADDAVAEAFARLLRRGDGVRDAAAWVWRVAFRLAAGDLQRRGRFDPNLVERTVVDPEPLVDLIAALGRLSDQQRAVVVLRDFVGQSGRATAEILGTTEASVRVQLSRARRTLRKELIR